MAHSAKKLKILYVVFLFPLLVAGACYFFRTHILDYSLQWALVRLEQHSEILCTYSSLQWDQGGNIRLFDVEIQNVSPQATGLAGSVTEIDLDYSLSSLFQGWRTFVQTAKIHIIAPSLEFTVPDTQAAKPNTTSNAFLLPPDLPAFLPGVDVVDGRISVHHPGGEVKGNNIQFTFAPSCGPVNPQEACLDIKKGELQVSMGEIFKELSLGGKAFYGNGILRVPKLHFTETNGLADMLTSIEGQRIQFEGNWFSNKEAIVFSGWFADRIVSLNFSTNGFNLENIPDFLPDLPEESSGKIYATGNIHLPLDHIEETSGTIDIELTGGSYGERTINRILLQAEAHDGILQCPILAVETPATTIRVQSLVVDIENLVGKKWDTLRKETTATLTAQISDPGEIQQFLPPNIQDSLSSVGILNAALAAKFHNNTLEVETVTVQAKTGAAELEDLTLSFLPLLPDWQQWPITVRHFSIEIPELSRLQDLSPVMRNVAGKATLAGHGKGTLSALKGNVTARGNAVEIAGFPLSILELDAATEHGALNLSVNAASQTGDVFTGESVLLLAERKIKDLTAHIDVNDIAEYNPLFPLPFPVSGHFKATLAAKGPFEQPTGTLTIDGMDLDLAAYSIDDFHTAISSSNNIFKIDALTAISGDTKFIVNASVAPASDWRSVKIDIEKLSLTMQEKEMKLARKGYIVIAADQLAIRDKLFFDADDGTVALSGTMTGDVFDAAIDTEVFSGEWISNLFFKENVYFDTAKLKATMKGRLTNPAITLRGNIAGLSADRSTMEFTGTVDTTYQNEILTLTKFAWVGEANAHASISGTIPLSINEGKLNLDGGDLSVSAGISMPDAAIISQILPSIFSETESLHGSLNLKGTWRHPVGNIDLQAKGFSITPERGLWAPPGELQASCQVQLTKKEIDVKNCEIVSEIGMLQASGTIGNNTSLAALFPLTPEHPVGKVALQGQFELHDLNWLSSRIEELRRLSGEIKGTFALTGPPVRPIISGDMVFTNGEMRLSPTIPPFREVYFIAEFNQNRAEVKDLRGLIGGAPFNGSGQYRFGGTDEENLVIKLQGTNLLFYRSDGVRIRGDAELHVQGNPHQPLIEGNISLTDCRYTKPVDFLSIFTSGWQSVDRPEGQLLAFHDEPLKDATLRIKVGTETSCSITNNLVKGTLRPELTLSGTGEALAISGDVYIDETKVSMPAGKITFDAGSLHFLPSAPDRPQLNLSGNARMMGYDINVQVTGTTDEPVVTLSSSPVLPNEELLMLLLTGRTPTQENVKGQRGNNEMTNVAVYIGRGVLENWFATNGTIENDILDRLQLDIGRSITQTGEDTMEAKFLLKKKMFSGNDELYLTGERDVWDDYNSGLRFVFRFN